VKRLIIATVLAVAFLAAGSTTASAEECDGTLTWGTRTTDGPQGPGLYLGQICSYGGDDIWFTPWFPLVLYIPLSD
jgi:hypothetical protein